MFALVSVAVLLLGRDQTPFTRPSFRRAVRLPRSVASIGVLIIFLNGFAPYFGLQTTRVLSMFSNLRTEGDRPNHLIVPASWKLAGYQDDLAEIVSSTDPTLALVADDGVALPYFELRRRLSREDRPLQVRYRRQGEVHEVDTRPETRSGTFEPVPWWQAKVLKFRPVDRQGPARCRW